VSEEKQEQPVASEKKQLTSKQIWQIVGLAADVLVTVFLLILSIILLANIKNKAALENATGFMGMIYYFMGNTNGPTVFLCCVVIPLFILLVLNIILTVTYYQKEAQKEKDEAEKAKAASLDNLSEEQKAALRAELLKEMNAKKADEAEEKTEEK
jgi:heme/copper-type cytochrome/quinol oxidase subunit 2